MILQSNKNQAIPSTEQELQKSSLQKMDGPSPIVDQNPKSRQWTDEEHVLYILFLELNREKIKSKLIRRSNSFYKEMSDMVKTKTLVQCRSHNQKYQEKYKYPHRIIREEKERLSEELYAEIEVRVKSQLSELKGGRINQNVEEDERLIKKHDIKDQKSIACQTDIQNTQMVMMMQRCISQPVLKMPQSSWHSSNWCQQWSGYPMMWFC